MEQIAQRGCRISLTGDSVWMETYSMCSRMTLPDLGGWTRLHIVVPSNLIHSVILLF